MDSAIQMADERMVYVTGDKEAVRAYERRQMALSDYNSAINYARDEDHRKGIRKGMKEGCQKGRQETTFEIARKMRGMGDSIEKIHTITGLSLETIERL